MNKKEGRALNVFMVFLLPFFVVGLVSLGNQVVKAAPDRFLVQFESSVPIAERYEIVEQYGGDVLYELPLTNVLVIDINEEEIPLLESESGVARTEREALYFIAQTSDGETSPIENLAVGGGEPVDVFVLDIGFDTASIATFGFPVSSQAAYSGISASGALDHGTLVSNTLASTALQNGTPITINTINLSDNTFDMTNGKITEGIILATQSGAEVISISLGNGPTSPFITDAITYANNHGVSVVVSADNCPPNCAGNTLEFGNEENVITVGNLDRVDELQGGDFIADIYAPGDAINSEAVGASFSTPRVAAIIADIKSQPVGAYDLNNNGKWDPGEVNQALQEKIEDGEYPGFKTGEQVKEELEGTPDPNPTPLPTPQPTPLPTPLSSSLPPGAIGVFGGLITGVIQCACTTSHVIIVGPPRAGRFHFVPGFSILHEYKQIKKIGAWVLGTYSPYTECLRLVCPCGGPEPGCCCRPVPHQGNIQIVGTSR